MKYRIPIVVLLLLLIVAAAVSCFSRSDGDGHVLPAVVSSGECASGRAHKYEIGL